MRRALLAAYVANLALALGSWALLPARVAIHFGPRGLPDSWASRTEQVLLTLAVQTVVLAVHLAAPWLLAVIPPRWVNMPHREYWLAPERRADTVARVSRRLWRMGIALYGFLFWTSLLVLLANLSEPVQLHLPFFLAGVCALLGYLCWWTVRFFREFRLPARSG